MKRIKIFSLRALFLSLFMLASASVQAADFSLRLLPAYDFALGSSFDNVLSANASLDLSLFSLRSRDEIKLSLQGGSVFMLAQGLDPVNFYSFGGALG